MPDTATQTPTKTWVLRPFDRVGREFAHARGRGDYSVCGLSLTPNAPSADASSPKCEFCLRGEPYPPCC